MKPKAHRALDRSVRVSDIRGPDRIDVMAACPYCAETVGAEARICRFCNRALLYSIVTTTNLSDRQKHEFFRAWAATDLSGQKHLPLTNYSIAKKELDKIPLTLAWDLNFQIADEISQKLNRFGVEKRLLGGLPSSSEFPAPQESTHRWIHFFYLILGISTFAAAGYWMVLQKQQSKALIENLATENSMISELPKAPEAVLIPQVPAPETASQEQLFPQERQIQRGDVDRLLSATVFIRGEQTIGSGFLISSSGYILSNTHVTGSMSQPVVLFRDGRSFKARKVREDERYDISLIKIDGGSFPYLELGDANEVYAGEPVITIGNPGGLSFTITRGIVSYNGRLINQTPYLQTDAAINPGNSGGPMINTSLKVIGINTLTSTSAQGISFALPINLACDSNGIASSIVSSCSRYSSHSSDGESMQVSHPRSTDTYQLESQSFYQSFQKEMARLTEEFESLKQDFDQLQAQINQDPLNQSLRERLEIQQNALTKRSREIQIQAKESEIRYIDQIISLLERQSLDSSYGALRPQIEASIDQARKKKKSIQDSIAQ